jgi:hypothetical protein
MLDQLPDWAIFVAIGAGIVFFVDLIGNMLTFSNRFVNALVTAIVFALIFSLAFHFGKIHVRGSITPAAVTEPSSG